MGRLRTSSYVNSGKREIDSQCFILAGDADIPDLDFVRGLIHIPNSKTKAGKRYVSMTLRVREKLLEWIGPRKTGWVLRSPRYPEQHVQRQALTVAWRRVCNRVGVSPDLNLYWTSHVRHGCDEGNQKPIPGDEAAWAY
jgi:integrase